MARVFGDNNRPDDTDVKDILSPFVVDRRLDCQLRAARRRAMIAIAEDTDAIEAFDTYRRRAYAIL